MEVRKVTGFVGAEIVGIDLANVDNPRIYDDIRAAYNEHGVIFFRDQDLTPAQLADFGRRFGPLVENRNPLIKTVPGHIEIEEMRKEPDQQSNIGDEWHTDQAHRENPCMGTMLYGRIIPPYGGDTLFTSTAAAYEYLPEELKARIEGLEAVNSHNFMVAQNAARTGDPDGMFSGRRPGTEAVHPVVKVHPVTGRKILYVNPAYTHSFVGMSREESIPLLDLLFQHALRPEFGCRFNWAPGSLAFWDNRQTWHYAVNDYQGHRRLMHRIMVMEDSTVAPRAAV